MDYGGVYIIYVILGQLISNTEGVAHLLVMLIDSLWSFETNQMPTKMPYILEYVLCQTSMVVPRVTVYFTMWSDLNFRRVECHVFQHI